MNFGPPSVSKPTMRLSGLSLLGLFACAGPALAPPIPMPAPVRAASNDAASPEEPSAERRSVPRADELPTGEGEEVCFAAVVVDATQPASPPPDESCFDSQLVPVEVCEFNVVERYFQEGRLGIAGPLFRELALRAPNTESGADAADRLVETVHRVLAVRGERRSACGRELSAILAQVRPIVCASAMSRAKEHCDRYDAALAEFRAR